MNGSLWTIEEIPMQRLVIYLWALLMPVGGALAQEYTPEKPTVLIDDSTAMEWLIAFVFLVGCGIAAFKPAKRVKLD